MTETQVKLEVYRRLDNRFEGLPDDSPRALELHNRRKQALHEVLDAETTLRVSDWGKTDDVESHELVEILIVTGVVMKYAVVPGLKFIAEKLAEKAVDEGASALAKWLVSKLRPQQESKKILNFGITLADGTLIWVDPPDRAADITLTFTDGSSTRLEYAPKTPVSGLTKGQGAS